jgi:hypothetical protein
MCVYNQDIDARDAWEDRHAEEFLQFTRSLLKEKMWDVDIAVALAFNHNQRVSRDNTLLFDTYKMTDAHAVCYLNYITGGAWEKDVNDAWLEIS